MQPAFYNEESLTAQVASVVDAQPWYAVYVKPQFESAVCRHLRELRHDTFLPVYRSRRVWSDRVKKLDLPLFPGYIFSRFNARDPWDVLNSPGVVCVVSAGRDYVPVDDVEIASLQQLCESGLPVEPWPYLGVGRKVVVERGPLAGAEGVVVELKNRARIVVSISMLQRSVSAEIDREWIRPA